MIPVLEKRSKDNMALGYSYCTLNFDYIELFDVYFNDDRENESKFYF